MAATGLGPAETLLLDSGGQSVCLSRLLGGQSRRETPCTSSGEDAGAGDRDRRRAAAAAWRIGAISTTRSTTRTLLPPMQVPSVCTLQRMQGRSPSALTRRTRSRPKTAPNRCSLTSSRAAHAGAMKLMGQMTNMMMLQDKAIRTDDGANLRVTRLAGAASRLMVAYQQGLVTLDRLRAGGKQTIIVQHVQVNDGGQAVVAGKVKPRAKGGGRGVAASSLVQRARRTAEPGGRVRNDGCTSCNARWRAAHAARSLRC